jgi:hypothetical protein
VDRHAPVTAGRDGAPAGVSAGQVGWYCTACTPRAARALSAPAARNRSAASFPRRAASNLTSRLARQSVLDRAELRVVILESVLYREVGDAATMCGQIQHLLAVGGRPSVMLQVVADTTAVAGALGGAFAIATEGTADVAAYAESNIQGAVYTDPDLVARAARVFDGLRADALPWMQTQDLLLKAGERWTL